MRSRYSAFALGNVPYLVETWHPRTRPRRLDVDADVRWRGLDVLATTGGSPLETEGTVEFRAHYVVGDLAVADRAGAQHENSRFVREHGRWLYLDGVSLS
jgi:SEC-C motif domain protein